jgi:hypothetical protein
MALSDFAAPAVLDVNTRERPVFFDRARSYSVTGVPVDRPNQQNP